MIWVGLEFAPVDRLQNYFTYVLGNNNINEIHASNFVNFGDLEILDLKSNHISNWYERVFEANLRMKIINLRSNNINLLTPEMLSDFERIKFLAIGANSFVCQCSLREFIDRAKFNAMKYQCTTRIRRSLSSPQYYYDVFLRRFHDYVRYVEESYKNILGEIDPPQATQRFMFAIDTHIGCSDLTEDTRESAMTFDFLLLDYNDNDYHCIESDGNSKQKVLFSDLEQCKISV